MVHSYRFYLIIFNEVDVFRALKNSALLRYYSFSKMLSAVLPVFLPFHFEAVIIEIIFSVFIRDYSYI
jgi:hypothetical protein